MKRRLVIVGVTALAASLLAACGSGSGGGSGGDTIKLLVSYPADNLIQDFPTIAVAAQAAAKAVNDAGGINGKKIEMLTCNNKDAANDSQTCARKAVQERVVSVVGQADLYSNQSLPVLASAGIPSVGPYTVGVPEDQTSENSFLLNAGSVGSNVANAYAIDPATVTSVAQAVSDVPVALQQAELSVPLLKDQGIDFKGVTPIPLTGATDFSPYAQKLKSTGAQAIACVISTSLLNGVIKATGAIGYNPLFLTNSQTYGEVDAAQSPGISSRLTIMSPYPSPRDTSDPLIAAYVKESAAFENKSEQAWLDDTVFDSGWSNAVDAWLSVHAVAKAFEGHDGDVTSAALMKILTDSNTKIDLYGHQDWQPAYTSDSDFYPRVNTLPIYYLTIEDGKLTTSKTLQSVNLRDKLG